MSSTTTPLSQTEQDLLDRKLAELPGESFAVRLVWLFYRTGMHPAVAADPQRHSLALQEDHLIWRRPKTKKFVRVPVDPVIRAWLPSMIEELVVRAGPEEADPESRAIHYLRTVREIGKLVGIPGLSPRGLRHTFIWRIMKKWKDPNLARQWAGCTITQAMDYAWAYNEAADVEALQRGF